MRLHTAILAISLVLIVSVPLQLEAQTTQPEHEGWPTKRVLFILPGGPGSAADRLTRILATHLSKKWGQAVVVENKPGATSIIGNNFVAKSAPDGYTLLSAFTTLVQAPSLVKDMPYDVEKDLSPVTQTVAVENVFVVRADSPYRTMKEFIAAAKTANPPLSYGTPGRGHTHNILGEQLAKAAGIKLTHVPYKSEFASTGDLLGGHLASAFASVGTAMPFLTSNKFRALAVASNTRFRMLPDVPSFGELGLPLPSVGSWFGVLAPAGTPTPVVRKIALDIRAALAEPELVRFLDSQGMKPVASTPEAFAERIHGDLSTWKRVLQEAGITAE